MVRQHLYRVLPDGGQTVAASPSLKDSAWLNLLEQQIQAVDYAAMPAPVFYQYPLGRGLVISRCAPDPLSEEGAYLAHQLVLDEMDDMEKFMKARPLALSHFLPYYLISETSELTDLLPEALGDETDLNDCYDALDRFFAGDEALLSQVLACLALCARDKRQYIRVTLNDTLENVSMHGRQLTELMLCALPLDDALRISYCTLQPVDSVNMQYTVCFSPDGGQTLEPAAQEILVNLGNRSITAAQGVEMPDAGRFLAAARALIAHELGGNRPEHKAGPEDRLNKPPFEKGMSLKRYFAEWSEALAERRSQLNEEAFQTLADSEWEEMLNRIVEAGEQLENERFVIDLSGILYRIRKEKLQVSLALTSETLTDLVVLLLDSISWRKVDLTVPALSRAVRNACAYAQVLGTEQFPEEGLIACRVVHRLLTAPMSILSSLEDMEELEEKSEDMFDALQQCFRKYVLKRLAADIDVIDEQLAAAAMMGFVRFTDGIPDLRAADKLAERIETQIDAQSARRFRHMLDKLRRHMRSTSDGMMIQRRRDMRLFLLISLLLVALISGISVWFLFLS